MKVQSAKPYFEDVENILADLREVLKSGRLILGPYTREFEEKFKGYHGIEYAVATSSCTSALEISLRYIDVKGKEVIVPADAYTADANSVYFAGGKPVFADIENNLCIDPNDVLERITPKTKAIIAIHMAGLPVPGMKALKEICEDHDLYLIEDCSHAHGAEYHGKKVGTLGDIGCFSFYPTKILTSGVGGMLITNESGLAEFAVRARHHGQTATLDQTLHFGNDWLMDELSAVIGIYQLKKLDEYVLRRNEIAQKYMRGLDGIDGVSYLPVPKGLKHGYYKFVAYLDRDVDRDKFKQAMVDKYEIEISAMYLIPIYLEKHFQKLGFKAGLCPKAEEIMRHQISLPMFVQMTDAQINFVLESLKKEISNWEISSRSILENQ